MSKPEPIRVAAEGIEAKPVTMNEPQPKQINWRRVAQLPPFQMFATENAANRNAANRSDKDAETFAFEFAVHQANKHGDEAAFEVYAAWHEQKGYWPNETPMGELKE